MIYQDGKLGPSYVKRFSIPSVTRDREYDLTRGNAGSKILHFSVNPKGEGETVEVDIKPSPRKVKPVLIDFSELDIKTRSVKGNLVTKKLLTRSKLSVEKLQKLKLRRFGSIANHKDLIPTKKVFSLVRLLMVRVSTRSIKMDLLKSINAVWTIISLKGFLT